MSLLRSLRLCLVALTGGYPGRGLGPPQGKQVSRVPYLRPPFRLHPTLSPTSWPPRSSFRRCLPRSPGPSPSSGPLAADVLSAPATPRRVPLLPLFLAPPGRAPAASVAAATARLSRGGPAVLGLQQGSAHEVAAENGLFLCELQESPGDLRRGSQTGVRARAGDREGGGGGPSVRAVALGSVEVRLLPSDS